MAILSRDTLKGYFKTGMYPTEEQFASLIDSMRHQSDGVPVESIDGLAAQLNDKASAASVSELLRLLRLKELARFYCEDGGGGRPLFTMAMVSWANACYVDPEDDRGITVTDVNEIYSVYLGGMSEYYTRLLTAHTENVEATLRQGVNTVAYIDGAALRFTVPVATAAREGMMPAADKERADVLWGERTDVVTDMASTEKTIAVGTQGKRHVLGTLTGLTVTGVAQGVGETVIFFTAGTGFTLTITKPYNLIGDLTYEAGASYVLVANNGFVVLAEYTAEEEEETGEEEEEQS